MCAFAGTTIRFSPSLYFTTKVGSPPALIVETVPVGSTAPLVMVPLGAPYQPGRWPSPWPRWDSAKMCTSTAFWLPSACGTAPLPIYMRSEERRVGKECRSRGSSLHESREQGGDRGVHEKQL